MAQWSEIGICPMFFVRPCEEFSVILFLRGQGSKSAYRENGEYEIALFCDLDKSYRPYLLFKMSHPVAIFY